MSENKPEELNSQAVPFFARFLEGQSFEDLSDQESEGIGGGNCGVTKGVTKKGKDELFQTRKYPSDGEDGVTKKHPSDDEQIFVTLKFPSDNEDNGGALASQK
ncbi:microviridin/marinostatin family tricyclic proteinase inhibitor [Nostoc commune]|nr:microviridin/marinostatin family tricyclic proteinase inhibitor [Nostoc commune]